MKLYKSTILIICLLVIASIAHTAERASISATATVMPMLGVMPTSHQYSSLTITRQTKSQILIQASKNSAILIHVKNANTGDSNTLYFSSSSSTPKNSVSEFYSIDVSNTNSPQIITIMTIDN